MVLVCGSNRESAPGHVRSRQRNPGTPDAVSNVVRAYPPPPPPRGNELRATVKQGPALNLHTWSPGVVTVVGSCGPAMSSRPPIAFELLASFHTGQNVCSFLGPLPGTLTLTLARRFDVVFCSTVLLRKVSSSMARCNAGIALTGATQACSDSCCRTAKNIIAFNSYKRNAGILP
eukprot:364410-Chlamydomonas_euryale.AAC.12